MLSFGSDGCSSIRNSRHEKTVLKSLELLFTEFLFQTFWVYGA